MQKAWTVVDFRGLWPKKLWPRRSRWGGGRCGGLRRQGSLAQFGREVSALKVRKTWHARTFAATELAPSMTLKS